jgi:squalene-associated FAD-dependent desaturase
MNVAVLGGGYAGMAAAVTLAERGVPVTVHEAAAHLGGRARRVSYRGTTLDNGLHVLIGACSETLRLIRQVGVSPEQALMRLPLDWWMHDRFRMIVRDLPSPFHLAAALITARGASLPARFSALRFAHMMRRRGFELDGDMNVAALLSAQRQNPAIIRYFWQPLCVSALNTPVECASARTFLHVLRDGLDAAADGSNVLVARKDLTALFPEPAARYVCEHGGTVSVGQTITRIERNARGFSVTARGTRYDYTHVICAVSPHRLLPLISGLSELESMAATVARFEYQPIHSIYLQYRDSLRLPKPMVGLADGLAHWVFDREAICGQSGLVGVVISAAGPHQRLTQEELALNVHGQLGQHFGPLPELVWHRVIAEKRASFACTPALLRPQAGGALPGFFLAGDYVAGDYPATLEGAVRSGGSAAQALLGSQHG